MLYFALIYCTGTRREKFIKSHSKDVVAIARADLFYDAFKLLGSSDGSEESNRSRGVPNWCLAPVLRLGHGRRPRPK